MINKAIKNSVFFAAIMSLILILSSWNLHVEEDATLKVVANTSTTEVSYKELKALMRGEKQRWSNGSKVKVALMKTTTTIGSATAKKVYGMTPNELNKYWLAQVFQGRVSAPQFFTSEQALVDYVNQNPGTIGVVSSAISASKTLKVDGKTDW